MNSGPWQTISQIVNLISALATALYNFLGVGKSATEAIMKLPEMKAERKASEVQQNKEIANSIVHLFAIEALFTFGRGLLLVAIFTVQTLTLARFAEMFLNRATDAANLRKDNRSPNDSRR